MFATARRRLLHAASGNLAQSLEGPACATSSKAAALANGLPPIRYHVFREPVPYLIGLKLQNDIIDRKLASRESGESRSVHDIILLLEHTPTYTTGRRDNTPNPESLHPEEKKVENVGADFFITKRGGQVTYHGPGQLVGYPILDLSAMDIPTRCYVDWLQGLLANHVRSQGYSDVLAPHPNGHVGVFASPSEKVASIGIHLRHRITSHGFALNVTNEPIRWFDLVTACGLADVKATSLQAILERSASPIESSSKTVQTVHDTARTLLPSFSKVFGRPVLDLMADNSHGADEDLARLQELVNEAEVQAHAANKRSGGWPDRPSVK